MKSISAFGAYGIAAASLVLFRQIGQRTHRRRGGLSRRAAEGAGALHPVRNRDRAIERRNYVIDRLLENGWIKQADATRPARIRLTVTNRTNAAHHVFAGEYFAEEVRRDIFERYGEKKLYEGGLSVAHHARSRKFR